MPAGRESVSTLLSATTRLATRLREAGKTVYGMGERKTPEAFIAACDKFIFFEVLRGIDGASPDAIRGVPDLRELLVHAVRESLRDSGWASLSAVGSFLSKTNASFDARNYGYAKLSELVRNQPFLKVREAPDASGFAHLHVQLKDE